MIAKKWNYQIAMTTGIQNAFQVLQLYFTTAIDSLHGKLTEVWNFTFAPSDFHFPETMWTLLRKLPYTMKFDLKVKFQTGLSTLLASKLMSVLNFKPLYWH